MSVTPKIWGSEEIIHASEEYWMKKLTWVPYACSSFHYHQIKDEAWYVVDGMARVLLLPITVKRPHERLPFQDSNKEIPKLLESGEMRMEVLASGMSLHIPPYMAHQVIASQDGFSVVEASTKHKDKDVVRLNMSSRETPKYAQ